MFLPPSRYIPFVLILFCTAGTFAQNITIEGTVRDHRGETLPGVTVVLNGGTHGVATDTEGYFRFDNLPKETYLLAASYIGYEMYTKTIAPDKEAVSVIIRMNPSLYMLNEVQVTENQRQRANRAESITVERIDQDFFTNNHTGSLMQTLRQVPGVHSMNVGTGISKPMIRGMGFYRVLVAKNGIKQGGQHWNSHIGLSIDQHCIKQLEIIKGPSSLRFGSDAIGGVINILPQNIPERGSVSGDVSFTGKSNTGWVGSSAGVSVRTGDFYVHANATYNSYGDYKIPDTDVFLLPAPSGAAEATHEVELGEYVLNTAGRERAASITTGVIKPRGNSYLTLSYHSAKAGFFDWMGLRHEAQRNLHQENRRESNIPYQQIDNYTLLLITNRYFGDNKLEVALGYQYNVSSEHSPLSDRTGNRREEIAYYRSLNNLELQFDLHNATANVLYSLRNFEHQTIDFILNTGYEKNLIDGYNHIIPEYEKRSGGIAVVHRYEISPQWIVNSGMRVDIHDMRMKESLNPDPAFGDSIFNPAFDKVYSGTAGALGVNYLHNENTLFKLHIGKSYRVPSAYELGAYGLHRHEGRFERGDLDINPEKAWQLDAGFEKKTDNAELILSPFVNYFTNYLFLNPTPDLRPEGQVYEYHQNRALLYGGEVRGDYTLTDNVQIHAVAEYVYALNLDMKRPLPFTPPFSAIAKVSYLFGDIRSFTDNRLCLEGLLVGAQNNTVPNELRTPGYFSLNINLRTDIRVFNNPVKLRLKARNILDNRYYDHVSFYRRMRIPEQGRDFQVFVSIPFSNI